MPVAVAIALFAASLALTLAAARLFARRLDRLGVRHGLPEALIGLLTALAADGPELASALFALASGVGGVGVGVLVGSNVFNLAAMIGLGAVLGERVRLSRRELALEGIPAGAVTLLGCAVILRWLAPAPAAALGAAVLVPYLAVALGLPAAIASRRAAGRPPTAVPARAEGPDPARHLPALIVLDVALIVAGSAGMVHAALALGGAWHLSHVILGVLVLAPLTSLPNAATAIRLARAGRGAALVAETFNSNTINLAIGVILPALFVAPATAGAGGATQLLWLVAITGCSLAALARRRGLGRAGGLVLIAAYLGFVAQTLASMR